MVILVCIVEMHTLNLLTCGYRLGTTLSNSHLWGIQPLEAKYPQQVMHTQISRFFEQLACSGKRAYLSRGSNVS